LFQRLKQPQDDELTGDTARMMVVEELLRKRRRKSVRRSRLVVRLKWI